MRFQNGAGLIRIQATRVPSELYFTVNSIQIAMDLYFFCVFLGAKMVGRNGSRDLALLVMADIVDFIELTLLIGGSGLLRV